MTAWHDSDSPRSLGHLIDCMEQVSSLTDPGTRRLFVQLLNEHFKVSLVIEDLPAPRPHLISIVLACRRQHPRGLNKLGEVLEEIEPGSLPVRRVRAVIEGMTAIELISDDDRRELLSLLEAGPIDRLAEFVRSAAGPAAALTSNEQHPIEALTALERLNARPDGVPPLLVFVELVAAHTGTENAERLRQWNSRQADRMGVKDRLTVVRLEHTASPLAQADLVACLVIRIEPDLLDEDLYSVAHWRHNDPAEWRPRRGESFAGNLAEVEAHVADLVAEAEMTWAEDAAAIRIEFLLPYSLLNLPVDQWDLEADSTLPRLLGLHYQVVVRSLDRARATRWHREWRRRWDLLTRMPKVTATQEQHWHWSDGAKPRQLSVLDAKLATRKDIVSLVLRSVPDGCAPGEVIVGVRSGVPVMIWQRTESGRAAFENEVKAMRDTLPELVERLRELRGKARQSARFDTHVGSRVALLWDDPDRPVEPQDPPAAPSEEASTR